MGVVQNNTKVRTAWVCLGGNPNVWFTLADDSSNLASVKQLWGQSITDGTQYPVHMHLKPIWELLRDIDDQKSQVVLQYLRQKWENDKNNVPHQWEAPAPFVCTREYNTVCLGVVGGLATCGDGYSRYGTSACLAPWGAGLSAKCRKTRGCLLDARNKAQG